MDSCDIQLYQESGTSNFVKDFFDTMIEKIKALYEKVQMYISDLIANKGNVKKVNDLRNMKKEELEKKKIEVIDTSLLLKHEKKYKDKVMSAKSVEEVDKIVKEYQEKRGALLLGSALVVIYGAAIIAYIKDDRIRKSVKSEYDSCKDSLLDLKSKMTKYQNQMNKADAKTLEDIKKAGIDTGGKIEKFWY